MPAAKPMQIPKPIISRAAAQRPAPTDTVGRSRIHAGARLDARLERPPRHLACLTSARLRQEHLDGVCGFPEKEVRAVHLEHDTWVVVADGEKYLLLPNRGTSTFFTSRSSTNGRSLLHQTASFRLAAPAASTNRPDKQAPTLRRGARARCRSPTGRRSLRSGLRLSLLRNCRTWR